MPKPKVVEKTVPSKKIITPYLIGIILVILVVAYFWKNKSLLVVATVNGQPIPRWSFESRMVSRSGNQILDEVVNEQIIMQAGAKKGIVVSEKEVAAKVSEIEKSLNGQVSLADALAGQGMTMSEFQSQIKLQLTLEKLVASDLTVTPAEIKDYLDKNKASLTATDEAGLTAEAQKAILAQKKNDALRKLFTDLKSQAKVVKYL